MKLKITNKIISNIKYKKVRNKEMFKIEKRLISKQTQKKIIKIEEKSRKMF